MAVWRALLMVALLMALAAIIAISAGLGSAATAVLTVLLAVTLVHALVLTPVARMTLESPAAASEKESSATVDESLGGIASQRSITAALLNAMAYANRYNHPLSVVKVEVELLRDISSGLGRSAGDKVLQTVGSVFLETLRMPDRAGRYGDEDFLILLPNTQLKNANLIAERLRNRIQRVDTSSGRTKLPLTVNIGVAQFRKGEDLERFLSRVDKALTAAKSGGRKRAAAG